MKNILASVVRSHFPTLSKAFSQACGLGLAAVVGAAVLTGVVGIFFLITNDSSNPTAFAFMMMATVLAYGLVLLVPAVALGAKRGWKAGVSVIVSEVIWLAVFAVALSFLFPSPAIMD